jgi:hypothetical protein
MADLLTREIRHMANTLAAFGFRQYSRHGLRSHDGTVRPQDCRRQYQRDLHRRPRRWSRFGYLDKATSNSAANGVEGIFIGCKYFSTSQKRTVWNSYWPGSDATGDVEAYIITDPNAMFVVQNGTSATAIGLADIGANVGFLAAAGNTATGLSAYTVDQSTLNTTNTLPFRVVDLVLDPPGINGTDSASGYNWVIVGFNNQARRQLTGI